MHSNYRYLLFFSLLLLPARAVVANNQCCESHQFIPRSITTDLVYTDLNNYYLRHKQEDGPKFIYSGNFIYERSNKSDTLGSAFLLKNGCNCVSVNQNAPADINSNWLGLANLDPANPFAANFCISPQRSVFAYYSYLYFDLSDWVCGMWADIATSVLNVRHKLNCCEVGNTASVCPGIQTVSDALNNPLYRFGKFDCGNCCDDLHRTGVDDIQVRLGYERSWCDDEHIWGGYLIGTIPTGRKPNAEHVFEPLIGSRHGSLGVGLNGFYQAWCNDQDHSIALMLDANYRYVFKRNECRTFDLCNNGAFSRFLLVADEADTATALPGINFFTQNIDVTPRSTVQLWLAMNYERCDYNLEAGYNFFWRQKETIACPCDLGATIGVYELGCPGPGCTSASTAKISDGPNEITPDAAFVALTPNDLNLWSGAADTALSNKFYASVATHGTFCDCVDWNIAFGGSYEFVNGDYRCATLPFWAVFGQFSFVF